LEQEKEKQNVTLRGLCVESRLCSGDWIEGEGKGREGRRGIVRHLLKSLDDETEGKIILKSIVIFKDLKCSINKNIVWLCERQTQSNTEHHNINKCYGCYQ
jgi:hypothetical protein